MKLEELEKLASSATREALMSYVIPDGLATKGFIESQKLDDQWIFEMYLSSETEDPQKDKLISRTAVDASDGSIKSIEIYLEPKES